MNKLESGLNHNSIKDTLRRATASLLVAGALSGPMTGEVRAEQNPLTPPSTTTETGTMPSQEKEVTDEYKKRIGAILTEDYEAPVPVEDLKLIMEDWRQKTFGPYKEELKTQGVENEEMLGFGSRLLWAWDANAGDLAKMRTYISREQIIEYTKTKQGLNVYCNKEGDPRILLLNTTKRMDKAFFFFFKWYEANKAPDALESIYNNGVCIWLAFVSEPEKQATSVILEEHGIINSNISEENTKKIKDEGFKNLVVRHLFVESYGVAHTQAVRALGITSNNWYVSDIEVVKSILAGKVGEAMKKVDPLYANYGESFNREAELFALQFGVPGGPTNEWVTRQLQYLTEAELIDPIGFDSWKEVPGMEELTTMKK